MSGSVLSRKMASVYTSHVTHDALIKVEIKIGITEFRFTPGSARQTGHQGALQGSKNVLFKGLRLVLEGFPVTLQEGACEAESPLA